MPPTAATAQPRPIDPLPEPLTPLLGRDADVAETLRLLDEARLVTLTGAGGSGKTRLALEAGHRVEDRGLRAAWVELAPIVEGSLVSQQIASALHIRQTVSRDPLDEVIDVLREEPTLLALDNCEHVVADVARVAERILRACPDTTILATSREPLGIAGERTWLVPPLASPDAVKLFAERARAVLPVFALEDHNTHAVEIICARLDGIPLAIELAAARVRVLAVWQIAERLNDTFKLLTAGSRTVPRHRTIHETIDWSFRLLSEAEQILFRRLAVFPSAFGLDAAEVICADELVERDAILDLISALVDKSLVICDRTAGKARYRLLETVRQFAAEKMDAANERQRLRAAHAHFFFAMAEEAEPRLFAGASDEEAIARIDDEIANVRAAFEWTSEDASRAEMELRLVYAFHWYWFARGQFNEARRRSESALRHREGVTARARGLACIAAGEAAVWQADWHALPELGAEAVDALRDDRDLRARATAYLIVAIGRALGDGDHAAAREPFAQALADARACGHPVAIAFACYWIGVAAMMRDDFGAARAALSEAIQVGLDTGAKPAIGHPSTLLGFVEVREGRMREAATAFARAVDAFVAIDDRWGLTHAMEGVALLLLDAEEREAGTRLLAAASAAWLKLGARPVHQTTIENEASERIRRALGDERLRVALASGASMSHESAIAFVQEQLRMLLDGEGAGAPLSTLQVRALGGFEIVREGVAIDAASLSARARELLVFLLCNRNGCTKEQIGAALWPDLDGAKLRNNFHVTLHRLRKVLGDGDWIVVDGEAYSIAKSVAFDVDAFETAAKAKQYERAADLYRGAFLANVTAGEWADATRKQLQHQAANALSRLARERTSAGDLRGATGAYEKLFAIDALDEEACRGLMLTLAKQGDEGGAIRVYRRFADALRTELDAEPEAATVKLYERIAAGGM